MLSGIRAVCGATAAILALSLALIAVPASAAPPRHPPAHGYRRKIARRYCAVHRTYHRGNIVHSRRVTRRTIRQAFNRRPVTRRVRTRRALPVRRDVDRDGIRNRRDRDRDNDGIRNRYDRRPRNPRRR